MKRYAMLMRRQERLRRVMRWLMALFYFTAGVVHLRSPGSFLPIVPNWVPMPLQVVVFTGIAEIGGAVGLLIPRLRWVAGVMLAVYAIAVFPANIKHAVEGIALVGSRQGLGYHIPRLIFQPVLVWWALFAGCVITWPFRSR